MFIHLILWVAVWLPLSLALDMDWISEIDSPHAPLKSRSTCASLAWTEPLSSSIVTQIRLVPLNGTLRESSFFLAVMALKAWTMDREKCVQDLKDHQKETYMIKWSPTWQWCFGILRGEPVSKPRNMEQITLLPNREFFGEWQWSGQGQVWVSFDSLKLDF